VQEKEILAQREQLHSKDEQLAWRQAEIERLQLLIARLRRMQFGRQSQLRLGRVNPPTDWHNQASRQKA